MEQIFFLIFFFSFFAFFPSGSNERSLLSLFHKVAVRRRRRRSVWRHFLALFFSLRNPPPSVGRCLSVSRVCVLWPFAKTNKMDDASPSPASSGSSRPALTNPMATNLRTSDANQFCSLQGQGALVTGASGGIGLAIVERLAECGVNVCIVARRVEKLNELKEKLETRYPDVTIFPMQLDVSKTSEEEMLKMPERIPFQVDILVNNAGLALGTEPVDTNSISDAMTVVNTNIMGVVAFTRAFSSGMRDRDRGHIVNISSIAGHEAYIGGSIYCATKHAVDAFTRSARHDLRNSKVRVSSVSPGAVRTDFTMTRFKGDADAEAALYRGFDPMIADDVADQVIYALSRPMRTQVCDIISLANAQSAARDIHRGD